LSNLRNLVRNENMKIYRRPRTWAMVGLLVLVLVAIAGLMKWDDHTRETTDWKQQIAVSNEGIRQTLQDDSKGLVPEQKERLEKNIKLNEYYIEHDRDPNELNIWSMMSASSMVIILVTLLTVIIAADMVAAEFSWGTIKLLLVGPASRSKILISKYIATMGFAVFLLVVTLAVSFGLGFVLGGTTGLSDPLVRVAADGSVQESSMLLATLKDYGLSSVQLIMYVTMAFMISAVFRSSAMAIALSLLCIMMGNVLVNMLAQYSWIKYILFSNVNLGAYFDGGVPLRPEMTLWFSVGMLAAYYLLFQVVTWLVFTKRDVAG